MARKHVARELERVNEPRWLAVTDVWGKVIETHALLPGADLKGAMVTTLARYVLAGWNLEEYSWRSALAFINRGKDRYMVQIRSTDPGKLLGFSQVSIEGTVKR
jgi:hypothetical protein